jgi:hypothetical protein
MVWPPGTRRDDLLDECSGRALRTHQRHTPALTKRSQDDSAIVAQPRLLLVVLIYHRHLPTIMTGEPA